MHRLLRYYNQNRKRIWVIILIIIFILLIVQVLNHNAKENNNKKETTDTVVSYRNESRSIISGETVPETYRNDYGTIIDTFFSYCINHEPEKAYEMLSLDTKNTLYPSVEIFKNLYYEEKFSGNKQYSFQAWSGADNIYIYQVKIFDDMLATGKTNDEYVEEYVTISLENGVYKLSINSFIGRKYINQGNDNDLIQMQLEYIDVYMDYQKYVLNVKNKTDQEVLLDTQRKDKTIYVTDDKNNRFEAILYELPESDLKLEPKEVKRIEIKINMAYRSTMKVTSINFLDNVVCQEYQMNQTIEGKKLEIKAE